MSQEGRSRAEARTGPGRTGSGADRSPAGGPSGRRIGLATPDSTGAADAGTGSLPAGTDGLRVLVYIDRDVGHPGAGGAEVYTHEVLRRLVDRGHEATVFSSAFEGCERRTHRDGVEVVRAGSRATVYGRGANFYRGVRGEYDVVVEELNGPPFLTPLYVSDPLLTVVHHVVRDEWLTEAPFPVGRLGYRLTDWWLKLYRSVPTVTVSASSERELSDLGFRDVTVARSGSVDAVDRVPDKPDRPTVAYVGRMVESKRPDHALAAFEHLREARPDARLHLVGRGYMLDDLRATAGEGVTVHGYVPDDRKFELMKRSHVLLVPSVREGWALVVTEANAMGTPAVGYDVAGLRDSIRNGENGLLAAEDPACLARRARTVLETDYRRYAETAIRTARRHDWATTADAFERRLREVAE